MTSRYFRVDSNHIVELRDLDNTYQEYYKDTDIAGQQYWHPGIPFRTTYIPSCLRGLLGSLEGELVEELKLSIEAPKYTNEQVIRYKDDYGAECLAVFDYLHGCGYRIYKADKDMIGNPYWRDTGWTHRDKMPKPVLIPSIS